ncbi:glycosyltransferase [Cerasicoccus fimbriatus]|uniref:glycosyltransferase n=1 Tax=Cerasicoccus fimbriatus TaxID=3014554 RepID=UPI0022B45A8D|nr:glycosyltransferase [Cerasicoccus sp. TK19100]
MKVLSIAIMKGLPAGVYHQMQHEHAVASKLQNVTWHNRVFTTHPPFPEAAHEPFIEVVAPSYGKFTPLLRYELDRAVYTYLRKHHQEYDLILFRYEKGDPLQYLFFKNFPNILTVHHTLELEDIKQLHDIYRPLRIFVEANLGPRLLQKTIGLVGVTQEIVDYEKQRVGRYDAPTFVLPNGIAMDSVPLCSDERSGAPKFVFAASDFHDWHGVDEMIKAFHQHPGDFELHLTGRPQEKHWQLREGDERIKMPGMLSRQELYATMAKCDVGLGSFGLHRKNMREACTLKVREYLAAGLPVWSGHRDTGLPADFPYYREKPLEPKQLIDFAMTARAESREKIRAAAAPHIEKAAILQRFADQLNQTYQAKANSR